ncbi:hypothetical protein N7493_004734 [Penicillium malachiteum]|uniref:Uncharacterized protein n=1 Tax=Penicillium malachiteum TaxID=1324776 RepID=A0AAD6HPT1_9EURO|nr:hypothetical protein N7493_004734 [Penicillium malachiteum]
MEYPYSAAILAYTILRNYSVPTLTLLFGGFDGSSLRAKAPGGMHPAVIGKQNAETRMGCAHRGRKEISETLVESWMTLRVPITMGITLYSLLCQTLLTLY